MHIDFTPVRNKEIKLAQLADGLTQADLRIATDQSIDRMLDLLDELQDDDVVFEPADENAHDPYAIDGEESIGWNLAHLILHVTASSEEAATFSSLLARGINSMEGRPRYETYWKEVTTVAGCRARLEESRRMRHAYLDTWPDNPHLDITRNISPRLEARTGPMNAIAAYLWGMQHELGHWQQMVDVWQQALAAREQMQTATG